MKNIITAACWAAILALVSCGKKDASLIGLLPVKPVVNPQTGVLLGGVGLVNVQMDAHGVIRGLCDSGRFETTDSFMTFQIAPVQLPAGAQYNYRSAGTTIGGMDIVSPVFAGLPTTIGYSSDYGTSWNSVTPDLSGVPTANYFSWQLEGLQHQGGNIFMASTRFADGNYAYQTIWTMLLFKVDTASGQTVQLLEKPNYSAESIQFTGPDTGFLIQDTMYVPSGPGAVTVQKGFFSRTTDGGATWSQPVALGANEPYTLVTGPDGRLVAYGGDGSIAYSLDAGATWKTGNIGQMLYSVFIASDNTIYASAGDGMIKTTNFGGSWIPITTPVGIVKLFFVDEQQGIAYRSNMLYSTSDGGISWKTLLYPYPYVIQ